MGNIFFIGDEVMLINAEEINDILFDAGTEVTNRGKKYFEQNRVKVADFNFVSENNYIAKALSFT